MPRRWEGSKRIGKWLVFDFSSSFSSLSIFVRFHFECHEAPTQTHTHYAYNVHRKSRWRSPSLLVSSVYSIYSHSLTHSQPLQQVLQQVRVRVVLLCFEYYRKTGAEKTTWGGQCNQRLWLTNKLCTHILGIISCTNDHNPLRRGGNL